MIAGILRFLLTYDHVIPTSYLQSHLGTIDKWSSMDVLSFNALLKRKMIE